MKQRPTRLGILARVDGIAIAGVLVVLYIVFLITAPRVFTGYRIYMSFLETVPPVLVCALGLTFVITAGEIDLSFPAVVAFSGFVFAWIFRAWDSPIAPWVGFIAAIAGGALIGYINGLLVARIGVPSIMATLAAQFFWYGVTILLAGGLSWSLKGINDDLIYGIFVGRLFGIVPVQAFWALGLCAFLWFILNRHKFGEAIMFLGDNAEVARVMGINVTQTRIRLFTVNGMIAAFAAVLLTLNITVFFPTQGQGFMLPALAAVFIGGTSIAGGYGSVFGSFFGAYVIGSLEAGVVASGISGYWVQLVEGVVMGASVVLNIVIEQGRITEVSERLRHWSGVRRPSDEMPSPRRDEAAK